MRDVGENKVLLCYGFVDEVLDGNVQIAIVVWSNDFFYDLEWKDGGEVLFDFFIARVAFALCWVCILSGYFVIWHVSSGWCLMKKME